MVSMLKQYVDEYMNVWPFSGVICVFKEGKVIFQSTTGKACHEFDIDNTIDTCFSLGSISKQFTAFSIMQLFDKGLVEIHVPANQYLPKALWIDERITLHHLMSHTSGLNQFYNFSDDFFGVHNRDTYNRQDYFNAYIKKPVRFEPGSRYEYCNAGYNVLAWIVENMSCLSFGVYLKENIFRPLGMIHSALDDGLNIIYNKAYPYQMDRDTPVRCQYYNEKFSIGAGAIVSNCEDLHLWYKCLKNHQLLSEKAYSLYLSDNLNNYCYGLNHDRIYGKDRYQHGGDHFGVMAYMQNFFADDICVIIIANLECGNHYRIGDNISRILFTQQYETPHRFEEIKLSEELAQLYEGVYLDQKIEIRCNNGNWEFVRCNGELHISIYPVGTHKFARKWEDQENPYELEVTDETVSFLGYEKKRQ